MTTSLQTTPTEASPTTNPGNTSRASWQFSLDDVRQNIAGYPQEARDALVSLFLWCIDPRHPMPKPDAARRVGSSDNLLYKLLAGKYRSPEGEQLHPAQDLIKRISEFLNIEKERFDSGETQFVLTPTARKISTACELARESNSIVFLWGPSHVGKTWALEHHTAANNHGRTIYSRLEAASGLGGMVRRIASDCGVSDKSNTADLVHRIKNALTQDTLLILDECHLLAYTYRKGSFHNCMEVIREIHDKTKAGLVLCFTLLDDVRAASQKELQQLWRRGVHKVPLPQMPTKADLTAILEHAGLPFPQASETVTAGSGRHTITDKPYDILRQLAASEGLKAITERLRYGRKLANKSGDELAWSHVLDAHFRIQRQSIPEAPWN